MQPTQPDPALAAIDTLIQDLQAHTDQNRTNPEQSLYTEALPRLIALIRSIRSCFDPIDPLPEDPEALPPGAYLEIRYQTILTLESLLVRLYQHGGKDDPQLAGVLILLLQDLYGLSEEGASAHLQLIENLEKDKLDQKIAKG